MRPRAPAHVDTLRAVDSGARRTAAATATVGTAMMARAIAISTVKGRASAPRPAGSNRIHAVCATTMAAKPPTYATSQRRTVRRDPPLRDDLPDRVERGRENPRDQEREPEGGPDRRFRRPSLPAAIDERQDEEKDDRNPAQQVAPEGRAELRLQRGALADRELREDVRDLQEPPGEQEIPVRDDQLGDLRAP